MPQTTLPILNHELHVARQTAERLQQRSLVTELPVGLTRDSLRAFLRTKPLADADIAHQVYALNAWQARMDALYRAVAHQLDATD